jgi:uncharacterized membrane protein YiaA
MLEKANRRAAAKKTVRKIEAGAIAFVVGIAYFMVKLWPWHLTHASP